MVTPSFLTLDAATLAAQAQDTAAPLQARAAAMTTPLQAAVSQQLQEGRALTAAAPPAPQETRAMQVSVGYSVNSFTEVDCLSWCICGPILSWCMCVAFQQVVGSYICFTFPPE